MQVSDRRLTTVPHGYLVNDEANKAVVFCGRVAFSFTGLAELGGVRSDTWLTQELVNARTDSLSEATAFVAGRATDAMKKCPYGKSVRRLAFVGLGWTILTGEVAPSPIVVWVSNAFDKHSNWLHEAEDEFRVGHSIGPAGRRSAFLCSHGQPLPSRELVATRRLVRRCCEHRTGPEPVAQTLAEKVRSLAERYGTVGKSLMVTCIPVGTAFADVQFMLTDLSPAAGLTLRDQRSFAYLAPNGQDIRRLAPNSAFHGRGLRNVKLTRLNETGSDAEIEATLVAHEASGVSPRSFRRAAGVAAFRL